MLKHLTPQDVADLCAIAARRQALEAEATVYRIDPDDPDELLALESSRQLTDELEARIESLSETARGELTALVWLGRGDEEGDFDALLAYARQTNGTDTPRYLAAKWPIGDYLQRGLRELQPPGEPDHGDAAT